MPAYTVMRYNVLVGEVRDATMRVIVHRAQ